MPRLKRGAAAQKVKKDVKKEQPKPKRKRQKGFTRMA